MTQPSPPGASSAEPEPPEQIAAAIHAFVASHPEAAVLEDGKVLFDLRSARFTLETAHGRCTLHLWSEHANLVRRVLSVTERSGTLRLATQRLGHRSSKLLELVPAPSHRTPRSLDSVRLRYLPLLERVLLRSFPEWRTQALRSAMDLEKSFGPAYARALLLRGSSAWAVIAVNAQESAVTVDGILTLGILWLQACRERPGGRLTVHGLKVILPRGTATLTLSRMAWLHPGVAQWELWELDEAAEELTPRDLADQGNLRTRLLHRPDDAAAAERFAEGIAQVRSLLPPAEYARVDTRLRSASELVFSLHGLDFARVRSQLAPNSFNAHLEVTVGVGPRETPLRPANRAELTAHLAELFARRVAPPDAPPPRHATPPPARRIGDGLRPEHARLQRTPSPNSARLAPPHPAAARSRDPLFRAATERWLESVLRRDLAPLTRALAPPASASHAGPSVADLDPDTLGNRLDAPAPDTSPAATSRLIPRLDPRHVYAQVPAIAGAGDRGLLDLLGITADGRLAVIELKAEDDLHFALQGLDYWVRVRHHHLQTAGADGLGEFQRHGYFRGVQLSPLPPRLYLVAPALHIHPATETILRFLSPRVEWTLLALDERWRSRLRVLWRRQGGG